MLDCTDLHKRTSRCFTRLLLAGAILAPFGSLPLVAADDSVTIGVSAPQSGGGADYGTNFVNGIKLALKELNGEITVAGKKVKLTLSLCDDEFKSDKATNCTRKLTSQDGARFIFVSGTYATGPILAFNQGQGSDFLVLGASADPAVTTRGNKLYVRTWANLSRYMPGLVNTLIAYNKTHSAGIEKVALMEVSSELGASWVNNFRKEWERHGKEIVGRAVYDQNGTDFYPQLTPLLAKKPDMIVLTTICAPSALVIKQARELGYKGTFMNISGCTGLEMVKLLPPKDVEGILFESSPWTLETSDIASFRRRFAAAYGAQPQLIAGVGYMDVIWLVRSMQEAKTTSDSAAIRAVMSDTLGKLPSNLLGWGNLDTAGDLEWPMHLSFVKDGATNNFTGK